VLLSLALLTVSFRESPSGPVHRLQGHGSQVLRPFQVVADRVAQPFEDAYGGIRDAIKAKHENEKLRAQLRLLRQQRAQELNALEEVKRLQSILKLERSPRFPSDFAQVNADVLTPATGPFEQTITIAGGDNRNIRLDDPVIVEDGLVGRVTQVGPTTSEVTLVSDATFAASARDLRTGVEGIVRHAPGASETLILDGIGKDKQVGEHDSIVTSGWRRWDLASIYPAGIAIGMVTSVNQTDIDPNKSIQVEPSVDFGSLKTVIVLIPERRSAGSE
jgi:rod shape-determining protein MreC